MSKQDRQGVRTATDLERKYKLAQIEEQQKTSAKQSIQMNQLAQTISQLANSTNAELGNLQNQIDETNGELFNLVEYLDSIVDYIIEQGESGIWHYEKWLSGKAKCWCTTETTTIAYDDALLGLGYVQSQEFPENLFTDAPYYVSVNGCALGIQSNTISNITSSNVEWCSMVHLEVDSAEVRYLIEAQGKWK